MRNIKITLQYHGADFFGWQKQDNKRTVQGELEAAIKKLVGQDVEVVGSGRTDRGVHALGQVANFCFDGKIPTQNMKNALNNLLPSDIRITAVEDAQPAFNARFSAKRKTYLFVVKTSPREALEHNLVCEYPYKLGVAKMKKASRLLVGKHDFRAFCAAGATVKSFEREIYAIKISKHGQYLHFEVTGNGFLYNMVRIIVGTLLEIGRGLKTEDNIKSALATGQREFCGKTLEPCGLYLKSVQYTP